MTDKREALRQAVYLILNVERYAYPIYSRNYGSELVDLIGQPEQVQLMKRRGGVGHDLSHLRPNGSPVNNSALTSTGLVPFMERYSNSTREVAQDGRRGALMLSVSIKRCV